MPDLNKYCIPMYKPRLILELRGKPGFQKSFKGLQNQGSLNLRGNPAGRSHSREDMPPRFIRCHFLEGKPIATTGQSINKFPSSNAKP